MIDFHALIGTGCLKDSGTLSGFQRKYNIGSRRHEKVLAPIAECYGKQDIVSMDELLWEYDIDVFRKYVQKVCNLQCKNFIMTHPRKMNCSYISTYEDMSIILKQNGINVISPELRKCESEESLLYISILDRVLPHCSAMLINATNIETNRDVASISKAAYNVLVKVKKPVYVLYSSATYESAKQLRDALAIYDTHWLLRGFGSDTENDTSGLVDINGNLKRSCLSRLSEAIR